MKSALIKYSDLLQSNNIADKCIFIIGTNVIESKDHLQRIASFIIPAFRNAYKKEFGKDATNGNMIFKASFDKANRTSLDSFRGVGLLKGLEALDAVKQKYNVPVLSDCHEINQIDQMKQVCDIIQIPAFLCRQTDLLVAAGKSDKIINIKKGQFASSQVMLHAAEKIFRATGNNKIILCDRGSSFGMSDLVFDIRSIKEMQGIDLSQPITSIRDNDKRLSQSYPVIVDATHASQRPPSHGSKSSNGSSRLVPILSRASIASGADGIFLEFHDDISKAPCDPLCQLPVETAEDIFMDIMKIRKVILP